jgi:hypothetical protein
MHQGGAQAMNDVTRRFRTAPDFTRARSIDAMAAGLGWFSIALGLAELLMTHGVARASGMQGRENLLRLYGVREIAQGVGLLMARNRTPWLMARVAGDVLDLVTLAGARNGRATAAMLAVGGATAMDVAATRALQRNRRRLRPHFDYSSRSGFLKPAEQMRGVAVGKIRERLGPHRMGSSSAARAPLGGGFG